MSSPARARPSQPRSAAQRSGDGDVVVDLSDGRPPVETTEAQRADIADQLKTFDEGADGTTMAETKTAPAHREVGISLPMTTTAQVEHRDAIRKRTQARLDALRARSPRTAPHSRRTARA